MSADLKRRNDEPTHIHSTIPDKSRKTLRLPVLPAPAFRLPNLPFSRVKPPFFKGVTPPFFKGVTPPLKRSHNITKLNPSQTTINKFQICSSSLTQNNHQFRSSTIVNSIGRQLLRQRWHAWAQKQGEAIEKLN